MYLRLLSRNLAAARVRVLAYALMTNHMHAVVVQERADSLAILFRRVHGRYAQYINTRRAGADICGKAGSIRARSTGGTSPQPFVMSRKIRAVQGSPSGPTTTAGRAPRSISAFARTPTMSSI
jgi:hypothetical protein